jgi:hypothetical protein
VTRWARDRKTYPSAAHVALPSTSSHDRDSFSSLHSTFINPIQLTYAPKSVKMSAIADSTDGPMEVVKVLFALFPNYNTLDVAGPLEVLSRALHDPKNKGECLVRSIGEPHDAASMQRPIDRC